VSASVVHDLAAPFLRTKALVAVAGDLNIARRNWNAYPAGHPLIQASLQKLLESFSTLCQIGGRVQIGITRDGLLLGEEFVEKNNQICRNVAAVFFERGIGALMVLHPPAPEELSAVLGLLVLKREEVFARGGIEKLWKEAGITALEVRAIQYDRFSGTEEERLYHQPDADDMAGTLWEQFVLHLTRGEVGFGGTDVQGSARPEILAAALNAYFARRKGAGNGLSANTLRGTTAVLQQALALSGKGETFAGSGTELSEEESGWSGLAEEMQDIRADLATFITALDPVLRRQILHGFCEAGVDDETAAADFFSFLGSSVLQQTYADAEEYAAAPEFLQEILRKLLPQLVDTYETSSADDTIRDKMHALLQEHHREAYMPDEYMQGLLEALGPETFSQLDTAELTVLLDTLTPQSIDSRGSEIILQLVIADPGSENAQELIQNLADLCGHFLEMGDYGQVLKILSQAADPRLPLPLRSAMRDAFCRREFLDEILSGLSIWGKPKYDQVTLLIQVLGRAFIEPMLDRMAEEENMSLRRFMMDRVQSFGNSARPYLLARLDDSRWYVLRNIIVMLRALGPLQEAEQLRPLLRHANQKVRLEALKSLMQVGDPVAQRQVLRDLDSSDRETQLTALTMVDRHSSPEMVRKLLTLVTGGGYTAVECELKSAAVQALGEIGRPETLPELAKVLAARSLLAFKALNRLKIDVVRSFEQYPAAAALPVLARLAEGSDEVARQAAESLKNLQKKTP